MRASTRECFAALCVGLCLAACVSGVAQNSACVYFGAACLTDSNCCAGLYCSEALVCAIPVNPDGGASSTGGASSGGTRGSTSGGGNSAGGSTGTAANSNSGGGSTSSSGAGSTGGFSEAAHSEPAVPNNGGSIIANPVLVTITYSDDTYRATEEAFDAFLVTSNWLSTVGTEYGIGAGSTVNVEVSASAPSSLDQDGVASDLATLIQAGTAPGFPSAGGITLQNAIYMVFYPKTTALTVNGVALCSFADGYHEEGMLSGGQSFSYGVIQDCPPSIAITDIQNIESATSHEFIEAATDPLPMSSPGYVISDTTNPWHALGGEVADLCEAVLPEWSEGGYGYIQRVFSNAASAAGGDPCVPAVDPYYSTDAEPQGSPPQTVPEVAAGSQVVFTLTGWSTGPTTTWNVKTGVYSGNFTPTLKASVSTLNNGLAGTLTVGVPAGTASGNFAVIEVGSEQTPTNNTATFIGVAVP